MKVAPSVLACNFAHMGAEVRKVTQAGADMLHLDVMDGHFVDNISFGPGIISSIRSCTDLPFDVHLMISDPIKYIDAFSESGADMITFHIESSSNPSEVIEKIKSHNKKVGIAVRPCTDCESVLKYLVDIDLVLVMTVEPGFGGQEFLKNQINKISKLRQEIDKKNLDVLIEVDGGINLNTVRLVRDAGADICVAGTSIFRADDMKEVIAKIKEE